MKLVSCLFASRLWDRHGEVCLRLDWFPCPNVGQASTNRDLRLYPRVCFSCIVTKASDTLYFLGVTAFVFRFINDTLEKFLLTNSRHVRSGEMRRQLYYGHQKFGQVRLPTNAATNADFLNHN